MTSISDIIQKLHSMKRNLHENHLFNIIKSLKEIRSKISFNKTELNNDSDNNSNNEKKPCSFKDECKEFIKSMFSAMIFALLIRTFLLQPFNIPSESMLPNLLVGDYLFVNKFAYGYSKYSFPFAPNIFKGRFLSTEPKRGDVVVFRVVDDGDKDYIKRIIGLPGDRIRFVNGSIVINDKPILIGKIGKFGTDTISPETIDADILAENLFGKKYEILDTYETPYDNTGEYIVPEGHYFFAGDNRDNSQDSRFIDGPVGFVPQDRIIGRAEFIFFSIKDSSFLEFWNWPTSIRFSRILKAIK